MRTDFHDISVNHVSDYVNLIDPKAAGVRLLASQFVNAEEAYSYVRDRIILDTTIPTMHPDEIIGAGASSCLGKAILLCSLYRAMGIPAEEVRIIIGELLIEGKNFDHAWLDVEIGDRCFQQDPSGLFSWFQHDSFPEGSYTRRFVRREHYVFNDKGFAVVSQANRFRGMGENDLLEFPGP